MSEESFVPENYEPPATGGGGYTKIELGENRFRILSAPLMMWVTWEAGKATKIKYAGDSNKPAKPTGENGSVKHVWGLVVWNYGTSCIEVLELDKQTLIAPLLSHSKDKDWGHPKGYDVIFKKEGSGRDGTKYSFMPKPHTPLGEEAKEAYLANPIDLNQLLVADGNPFLSSEGTPAPAKAATPVKTVTFENWAKGDAAPAGYKINEAGDGLVKDDLPF